MIKSKKPKANWMSVPGAKVRGPERFGRGETDTRSLRSNLQREYDKTAPRFIAKARAANAVCPVVRAIGMARIRKELNLVGRIDFSVCEVHHTRGRAGMLMILQQFWLAVSSSGHAWIHRNLDEARQLGLVCQIGEWNTVPREPAKQLEQTGQKDF